VSPLQPQQSWRKTEYIVEAFLIGGPDFLHSKQINNWCVSTFENDPKWHLFGTILHGIPFGIQFRVILHFYFVETLSLNVMSPLFLLLEYNYIREYNKFYHSALCPQSLKTLHLLCVTFDWRGSDRRRLVDKNKSKLEREGER
jgi:hypothetical protein